MYKNFIFLIPFLFLSCNDDEFTFDPFETGYVSYFSFDNRLNDETGFTLPEGNQDSIRYTSGITGNGLIIDEHSGSVLFNKKTFRDGQKLSVSLWFKTLHNSSTWHFIQCSDFTIFTKFGNAGMTISIPTTKSAKGKFIADEWNHFVGTYDGTTIKGYINGELVEETEHRGEISDPDRFLEIGDGFNWKGIVDELYIYNQVLNSNQVNELYNM